MYSGSHGRQTVVSAVNPRSGERGYDNNDMFVIPKWQMVVVRLGLDQSDHPITDKEFGRFLAKIGEAVSLNHDGPLPSAKTMAL